MRRQPPVYDVVTPTPREAREADRRRRQRRYAVLMSIMTALIIVGFFLDFLPVPVRLACCAVAAVLPPVAGLVANRPP